MTPIISLSMETSSAAAFAISAAAASNATISLSLMIVDLSSIWSAPWIAGFKLLLLLLSNFNRSGSRSFHLSSLTFAPSISVIRNTLQTAPCSNAFRFAEATTIPLVSSNAVSCMRSTVSLRPHTFITVHESSALLEKDKISSSSEPSSTSDAACCAATIPASLPGLHLPRSILGHNSWEVLAEAPKLLPYVPLKAVNGLIIFNLDEQCTRLVITAI
mmetsp:Transcript_1015/g.2108  ORF Transcript_1015/g.2108 Transcript_1015/m.2108 type:complete len:217 (+) Transcript_1015:1570-2220(+)